MTPASSVLCVRAWTRSLCSPPSAARNGDLVGGPSTGEAEGSSKVLEGEGVPVQGSKCSWLDGRGKEPAG